jgi:hypothetical protein
MTRFPKSNGQAPKPTKTPQTKAKSDHWLLQDAKARFSEIVRKAHSEGPQHITVRGPVTRLSSSPRRNSGGSKATLQGKR